MTATLAAEAVAPAASHVWVSYARLSRARNDGKGGSLAIDRQHGENADYIRRIDPDARITFLEDDGYSGYKDVFRPAFEDALALVANRQVRGLVGWHADRLTRQVEVTARIVKACETARVELHTTLGGWHADPTKIYIESIMAENESRQKSNRLTSKHKELAMGGKFNGGRRRYGYSPRMDSVIESEAAVILDLANRALNGESLSSLARSLNAAGVPTTQNKNDPRTGKPYVWSASVVKNILVGGAAAGYRKHTRDGVTEMHRAEWPAILDQGTFEALRLRLRDPERRTNEGATSARYLLPGLALCGPCGEPLRAATIKKEDRQVYRCAACHKVNARQAPIDEMVRAYVVARLEETDANGLLVSDEDNRAMAALTAERDEVPAARARYAAMAARGDIDPATLAAMTRALADREAELAAQITLLAETAARPVRALDGATGPDAGAVWDAWTEDASGAGLARQRAVVALLLDVRVHPAGKGKRRFNPDTVQITYRDLT